MSLSKVSFRTLLTTMCLFFALVPMTVMMVVSWRAADDIAESNAHEYLAIATEVADKIDRNLFERYGDVQAFGVNAVVQQTDAWGKLGADNPIVKAMNQYVDMYDVYYLSLLVDRDGKLVAVNSKDSEGKDLDTSGLYSRDFSKESWFQDALAGKFFESKDKKLSGTVVEDLYVDDAVKGIYGDEGLALGFSAPVRNAEGEVIAVWKNVAKFRLVEDIIAASYQSLKERGLGSAEITLLDKQGNVIVDYDPTTRGTQDVVRDMAVIGKLNLADKGVEAAQHAIKGETGSLVKSRHVRKGIDQCAGFTPFRGAMGFPGMNWYSLVRVSCAEALATANQVKSSCLWTFGVAIVAIILGALYLSKAISRVLTQVITSMEAASKRDYSHKVTSSLSSDFVRMCSALNHMLISMTDFEEQAADSEGQIAAIGKAQAVMFGREVEARYGKREFLLFYLVGIIAAGLVWSLSEFAASGGEGLRPTVGASGALAALVVLFAFNWPHRQVLLFFIIPMPMWVAAALGLLFDVKGAIARSGDIAFTCHLGGALYGLMYYKFGWRLSQFWPSKFAMPKLPGSGPKLRVHDPEEEEEDSLSQQVDRILEKIQREGQDSLTWKERRTLEKASKQYQEKRK